MQKADIRKQWEGAAPGWAKWEETFSASLEPATTAMLDMAGICPGAQVLDLASGAGSQTLSAARRVGVQGHVVASDISETMLQHVQMNARSAGLDNVTTLAGAAEDLDVGHENFDAVICRLGLMHFTEKAKALTAVRRAIKPGGKIAVVVYTTPENNEFMTKPMQILLRHAGKAPPPPGQPGIFSLGASGVIERLFMDCSFVDVEQRAISVPLRMVSATQALEMMREAFGAYRTVLSDSSEAVRIAAWAEVGEALKAFETETGFEAPTEVLVAAATKPT
jgi:ubiquinone/menaquinone biosynthesis C-methylase UbiE